MKKILAAVVAGSMSLAGCSRLPDVQGNIANTQQIIDTAQGLAKTFCGILPLASTIGAIVAAMAGAGPIEAIATQAAHAFCDAIPPQIKAQVSARRSQLRAAGAPASTDGLQTFGVIVINGKTIPLQGYVAP